MTPASDSSRTVIMRTWFCTWERPEMMRPVWPPEMPKTYSIPASAKTRATNTRAGISSVSMRSIAIASSSRQPDVSGQFGEACPGGGANSTARDAIASAGPARARDSLRTGKFFAFNREGPIRPEGRRGGSPRKRAAARESERDQDQVVDFPRFRIPEAANAVQHLSACSPGRGIYVLCSFTFKVLLSNKPFLEGELPFGSSRSDRTEDVEFRGSALSLGGVQGHRGANESLQCLLVYRIALVEVDGAPCVPLKTGVEQPRRVRQSRPFGEGHLDHVLVSLAGAD